MLLFPISTGEKAELGLLQPAGERQTIAREETNHYS
jgi:hypothetical protein